MTTRFSARRPPLRARWTVDPADPAGRRMIAVWAREIVVPQREEEPQPVGAVR
ncbi:hypothetical protein [Kibdelosporangium phytohabitans]|uniref:hypothetical protein n=1 Tax=Kibdelosporangium phytohabitans TaxID=860235 RepID=UPI001A101DD5|nr:hypothetical protein [Kibdelosporangium phytohabitans]MBE1469116.1 hypothetical protein [Kibdelosporangium phytohabitans]